MEIETIKIIIKHLRPLESELLIEYRLDSLVK